MGKADSGSKRKRRWRLCPDLRFECDAGFPDARLAGVDEVGRGCLAGPVVAAAVVLPPSAGRDLAFGRVSWLPRVTDSKALSAKERLELEPLIKAWVTGWAVGEASVEEINELNIYHASHLAMVRAVEGLGVRPDHVLVDGNRTPPGFRESGIGATPVVKGDFRCLSVACGSVIAKVYRDALMVEYDRKYPGYAFASNKGYPSPAHKAALKKLGALPVHRRAYFSVKAVLEKSRPDSQIDLI